MTLADLNLLVHVAATFYMAGLIWFVQRVHYPLFDAVGADGFRAYARAHVKRTNPVVGPAMLLETLTGGLLFALPPHGVPRLAAALGLGLLAAIWVSTLALQVPRHRELETGFASEVHRRLVRSNWIRTIAWSARGLVVLWMAAGWNASV